MEGCLCLSEWKRQCAFLSNLRPCNLCFVWHFSTVSKTSITHAHKQNENVKKTTPPIRGASITVKH